MIMMSLLCQVVAVPDTVCSVCGMPSTVKKPDVELCGYTQGSNLTDTPQTFNEDEDSADSKGLSISAGTENKGLSDLIDVQSEGSAEPCCFGSTVMNGTVLPLDEVEEQMPESEIAGDVEHQECDNVEAELVNGSVSPVNEETEVLDVVEDGLGNETHSTPSTGDLCDDSELGITLMPDSEAVSASNAAAVQDETSANKQCPVSDADLGELLSCAECGSSGLYNSRFSVFLVLLRSLL